MEAIETLPAKVETPGAVTIPAHTLHDIVRKLPDGAEIHIERKGADGRLKVTAGRASFELAVLPADEFPDIGQPELPHRFTVEGGELKTAVRKGTVRDLDRRNALLSEWHLSASGRRRGCAETQGCGDRRSPSRPGGDRMPKGHRRHARRDCAQESRRRDHQATRRWPGSGRGLALHSQDPVCGGRSWCSPRS